MQLSGGHSQGLNGGQFLFCSLPHSTLRFATIATGVSQGHDWMPMPEAPRVLLDGPYAAPAQRWEVCIVHAIPYIRSHRRSSRQGVTE